VGIDQRSVARPAGAGCDIGATEIAATPTGTDPGDGPAPASEDQVEVTADVMADVLATVSADLGSEGTLPATGTDHLGALGAIGAALVIGGRLLLAAARRPR
jgi:LPXTG-motif cell wall-anchored protein